MYVFPPGVSSTITLSPTSGKQKGAAVWYSLYYYIILEGIPIRGYIIIILLYYNSIYYIILLYYNRGNTYSGFSGFRYNYGEIPGGPGFPL